MRTSLSRFAPVMRKPDPERAYQAKKEAWQEHGILMVDPANDINWDGTYEIKQTLKNLGDRLYGKRKR